MLGRIFLFYKVLKSLDGKGFPTTVKATIVIGI